MIRRPPRYSLFPKTTPFRYNGTKSALNFGVGPVSKFHGGGAGAHGRQIKEAPIPAKLIEHKIPNLGTKWHKIGTKFWRWSGVEIPWWRCWRQCATTKIKAESSEANRAQNPKIVQKKARKIER